MKSSYELAMERLNKTAPVAKLSADQKKQIAELESKCKAKIAEREIALKDAGNAAAAAGDFEKVEQLQQQLIKERTQLQADLEEKKDQIHKASARK
jgi:chromosome segregation ATPase